MHRFSIALLLTLSYLLAFPAGSRAQEADNRASVHLDKPFYVLGEVAWFSIVLPPVAAEKGLLDAVLIDPDGQPVDRYRLCLEEGRAAGYQKFGFDWPAGRYRLLFSIYDQRRQMRLPVAEAPLPVYDDLAPVPEGPGDETPALSYSGNGPLRVTIETDPAIARPGQTRRAFIRVTDAAGRPVRASCSMAVTDALLVEHSGPVRISGEPLPPHLSPDTLLHLQGEVIDSSGRPFPTSFLGAFLLPADTLTIIEPIRQGRFDAALPVFYGKGAVQIEDYKGYSTRVRLEAAPALPPAAPLSYDDTVWRYLEWSRQRKKIYQLFQEVEMPLPLSPPGLNAAAYRPDRRLRLDDYTPMEDLPTFFREVATPLKFRRQGGRLVALMFNPDERRFYPGQPLFIVDGQLTWDVDYIAQLDIRELAGIDLYFLAGSLRRHYGPFGRYGVAVIRSRSGELRLPDSSRQNVFPLDGLQAPAAFPALPDTNDMPRFRPQLYWNPGIKTDEEGRATVEFRQSDALSIFRIDVVAHSDDGRSGTGTLRYEVETGRNGQD